MTIALQVTDQVAWVTIDRPEVLNAVDAAMHVELEDTWRRIEADASVRAVVITGAGDRAFCVGSDLRGGEHESGLAYLEQRPAGGFGGLTLRRTLEVPVLARVNGYAVGGGFELLLGCDLVVAADHAQFGLPEPRVGRVPLDGGMVALPRRLPPALANELLLTGKRITARQAQAWGLVNLVVPADELDAAVEGLLEEVLACAPLAVRAIKQFVRATAHLSVDEAHATRTPGLVATLDSEDGAEGVLAFQEKRAPRWQGR